MWAILFLVLIIFMAAGILGVLIKKMDSALNFSMKKKIRVKRIPLYFPNDRANETKLGETLENPNEGVYLPAFICSLVTYFIVLLSIVYVILVFTIDMPVAVGTWLVYGFIIFMVLYGCVVDTLLRHYTVKYLNHQEEWKAKIKEKLAEREKNSLD